MKIKTKYIFNNPIRKYENWYIAGVQNHIENGVNIGTSEGIFEWCNSPKEAIQLIKTMSNFEEFCNLQIGSTAIEKGIIEPFDYTTDIEFELAFKYLKDAEESIGTDYYTLCEVRKKFFKVKKAYQIFLNQNIKIGDSVIIVDNVDEDKIYKISEIQNNCVELEGVEEQLFQLYEVKIVKPKNIFKYPKTQVDFDMLKAMLRKADSTSVTEKLYCTPTQDELANLAVFFECMKNPKFATKASHLLK